MAIVNYQPNRMTKHLEDGEYEGVLTELIYDENYNNFWFKIKVQNQIFNTFLSGKSIVMNNFAKDEFTAQRSKLNLQIDEVNSKISSIDNGNNLKNQQNELFKDIEKTVNELIDGVEYEDEFYKQILDKMVIVDENTIDLYLNILPEKWRFSVSKTVEPIYKSASIETEVPREASEMFHMVFICLQLSVDILNGLDWWSATSRTAII